MFRIYLLIIEKQEMKNSKISHLIVVIFCFLAISCNNNNGENGQADSSNVEQNIQSDKNVFELPKELEYTRSKDGFSYDRLYPIGWSKDGKFAYIVEPAEEESGFYLFEIIILDIVNNKVVWSWKPEESEEGDLATTWKDNYEIFEKQLNEAEIQQSKKFELKATKGSYKGNEYELIMESKTKTDPDFGVDMVDEFILKIISDELGTKDFYEQKTNSLDYILSAYVPGYLLSPHDDRIVVICHLERIGATGPPNVVFFELVGTDLIRGFKKEEGS